MTVFSKVILYTDTDGRARFREEAIPLGEGSPQAMLSEVFASGGYQLACRIVVALAKAVAFATADSMIPTGTDVARFIVS